MSTYHIVLCFRLHILVFELPNDITTRSLSLAMLSEARMMSIQNDQKSAEALLDSGNQLIYSKCPVINIS